MELFRLLVEVVGGTGVIGAAVYAATKIIVGFAEGQKSLLRAEMLKIYYKYKETKEVPEYELANFHKMFEAYTNLHGNSFMKDVKEEVETWSMVR